MTTIVCANCKRTRTLRARGLCGSCYVILSKTYDHLKHPVTKVKMIDRYIEEIEFLDMDWAEVTKTFSRTRLQVKNSLDAAGRPDLVVKINRTQVARHGDGSRRLRLKV